jgi:hypothetical protein
MRWTTAIATLLITCSAGGAATVSGQSQTSGLSGVIFDETHARLTDVVVTVSSPELIGGPRSVRSDAQGHYRFSALAPGDYTIIAQAAGFLTLRRNGIELPPGLVLSVDLQLTVSSVETTVNVTAPVPAIDVRSSASPHIIERELLENVPVLGRSVSEYASLAPGVTMGVAFGGAAGTHAIAIDGTAGNDPAQGRPDAQPVLNWLESLQVVSVGAGAEHGEYTSARLNALTRSGANQVSGLGDFWWTTSDWARWADLREWRNASAQVGGPVRADRLWYFAGGEYFRNGSRPSGYGNFPPTADEPIALTTERKALLKISAAPIRGTRLEGFLEGERLDAQNGNAGPNVLPEARSMTRNTRSFHNLRFGWPMNEATLLEAAYGRFAGDHSNGPSDAAGRSGPPPRRDQATRAMSGNVSNFADSERVVWSAKTSVTRFFTSADWGQHELKAGIEHERARLHDTAGYPGGALYLDRDGLPELVRFWEGWNYRPSHHRTSAFVQDKWQFKRVTFEPGLRINQYGSAIPGSTAPLYRNYAFAPRLGMAWDVTAQHDTVLRVHYGHYHDPMATRFYEAFDPVGESPTTIARVLGPDRFEVLSVVPGATADNTRIDPAIKHSYTEEWFIGFERAVASRLSIKTQYIRRNVRNAMGYIDVGSTWTPTIALDPGRDGRSGTADDRGALTLFYNMNPGDARYLLTNPTGAWRRYDAVQVIAVQRPANGLALQASYTWAHTRGNFDNDNGSNAANTDMATNGNFANPNRAINATGRTAYDRRHDVRVLGTYLLRVWGGFRMSGIYRFTSGAPWARQVNSFSPLTGATNVLVEPVGTSETPATSEIDLRVEKVFSVGGVQLSAYGDVFNAADRVVAARFNATSGSAFGSVVNWTQPRRFRMGLRASF